MADEGESIVYKIINEQGLLLDRVKLHLYKTIHFRATSLANIKCRKIGLIILNSLLNLI